MGKHFRRKLKVLPLSPKNSLLTNNLLRWGCCPIMARLHLSGCKSWISPGIDSLRCSCFVDSFSANYLLLKVTSSCQIQENSLPLKNVLPFIVAVFKYFPLA